MPELPEVETIRIGLQKYLVGHKIAEVDIRLKKQFIGDPKSIIGSKIIAVRRFGKGLVIDLNNGFSLAIHVKMTGQLIYVAPPRKAKVTLVSPTSELNIDNLPDKYTHIIFLLDKGSLLFYRDIRQFGWIKVVKTNDVGELPFFKALGLEPLNNLTFEKYLNILKNKKTPIKLLLMDQTKIAGIGNIYANDALFEAKIHPARPASSLTDKEIKSSFDALEKVLKKGIEAGGASQWNYVNLLGKKGGYQNFFQVYNRAGRACLVCGSIIVRSKMGGRGTFYCPVCQPLDTRLA